MFRRPEPVQSDSPIGDSPIGDRPIGDRPSFDRPSFDESRDHRMGTGHYLGVEVEPGGDSPLVTWSLSVFEATASPLSSVSRVHEHFDVKRIQHLAVCHFTTGGNWRTDLPRARG